LLSRTLTPSTKALPPFLNPATSSNLTSYAALLGYPLRNPPFSCFHFLALAAKVALFLTAGLEECLPLFIHS
jgi:hypothetical protein